MVSKVAVAASVMAVVAVVAVVGYAVMNQNPGGYPNDADERSAKINGTDYTYEDMVEKFGTRTVDGKTGVPLGAIVNDTDLTDQETHTYVLSASDGYAVAVNWTTLQSGIVVMVTETDDETGNEMTYLSTYFPGLPSAYKVGKAGKDFSSLEAKSGLQPISLNGIEFYIDYKPKRVDEKTVRFNQTTNVTGWSLSDMLNFTLDANQLASEPGDYVYTIVGYDPSDDEDPWYNKTVSWEGMMGGVLAGDSEDETRVWFADSTDYARRSYLVHHVIAIIVE
jgi:hypothetical protein